MGQCYKQTNDFLLSSTKKIAKNMPKLWQRVYEVTKSKIAADNMQSMTNNKPADQALHS